MQKYKKNAITFLAFEHSTLNQRKTLAQVLTGGATANLCRKWKSVSGRVTLTEVKSP